MKITLCLHPDKRTEARVVTDDREYTFLFGDVTPKRALALVPLMIRDIKGKQGGKRKAGGRSV